MLEIKDTLDTHIGTSFVKLKKTYRRSGDWPVHNLGDVHSHIFLYLAYRFKQACQQKYTAISPKRCVGIINSLRYVGTIKK